MSVSLDPSHLKASYQLLASAGTDADQRRELWTQIRHHFPGLAETMWEQYQGLDASDSTEDPQRQRIGGALFMLLAIAHAITQSGVVIEGKTSAAPPEPATSSELGVRPKFGYL